MKAGKIFFDTDILQNNLTETTKHYKDGFETYFKEYPSSDDRISKAFNFYRYISLFLTSLFYLLSNNSVLLFKLAVVLFLLLSAVITLQGYKRYKKKLKVVAFLILLETMTIAVLVSISGEFNSPFLWYALNPLIVASAYLPMYYTWMYLGIFFFWTILRDILLFENFSSFLQSITMRSDLILIMLLLTLVVQVFTRLYFILKEQSQRLQIQQDELISAFQNLSQNNQMFQSLSNFQRDIVSFKNEEDIYLRLLKFSESVFPLKESVVLLLDEPVPPELLTPNKKATILGHADNKKAYDLMVLREVKDLWQDFSTSKILIAADKSWIALPIWYSQKRLMAVYVGWLKPEAKVHEFKGTLPLFIYFTEQVIQGLYSLHQAEQNLDHISSLYEAVETISGREDPKEVIDLFAAYAKALTGCDKVIFWMEQLQSKETGEVQNSLYAVRGKKNIFPEEQWHAALLQAWSQILDFPQPVMQEIEDFSPGVQGQLICVPVKSRSRCFGMLAALQSKKKFNTDEIIQTLSFLAELSAVSIERNMSEMFADKLLVIEEQNRIANEIHDSISQNLFSIVYGLDVLVRKANILEEEDQQTMYTIRDVASKTAKELRLLIYRLSPRHRGDDTFVSEVRTYLDGLASLNRISIDVDLTGKEEFLNPAMRKAFYRIIKEATGNAVRHGQCSHIRVELGMSPFESSLIITDNGKGFDTSYFSEIDERNGKLGLVNMRELAFSLQGVLSIDSKIGDGTKVSCSVPTAPLPRVSALTN